MDIIDDFARKMLSRRGFLAGAGTAAAAVATGCNTALPAATAPPAAPTAGTAPTYSDTDILNFALNLEYLESEFYLRAATGTGLSAADAGSGAGTVVGGSKIAATLTTPQQQLVNIIAQDELNHVRFLRAALGSVAVPRPNLDLVNSFNALATAATVGLTPPLTSFNPFASFNNFLLGGFVFEDVGVTAYHGGAGALSAKSPYLTPAAQILAVEAYHAAALRTNIAATAQPTSTGPLSTYGSANATLSTYGTYGATTTAPTLTVLQIANAIATFRAAVSGGTSVTAGAETLLSNGEAYTPASAAGVTPATTPTIQVTSSSIVAADGNAIAFARTFDQVLHIVYGTQNAPSGYPFGVTQGAFFPNGLNGNIKQTYS